MSTVKSIKEMIENATTKKVSIILKELVKIHSEIEKETYITQLSIKLKIPKKAIQSDLKKLYASAIVDTPAKETETYTEKEVRKAMELLEDPNLLDRFLEMTERVGIVKERINKLCLYLAYTSRKLESPICISIHGQSSAGKNFLSEMILENFIPESEYHAYSRITPQSLYYLKDGNLSHKILCIFENEGASKADYTIRTAISEKKLKVMATIKDPKTGKFVTVEHVIDGPIQYTSTTTKTNIHPENATRVFTLDVDDSPEKIRASLEMKAKKYSQVWNEEELKAELRIWRCAQTLLLFQKVITPFAPFIVDYFPTEKARSQRDFQAFLSLVESSALLYQYQRDNADNVIIATVDDYEIARRIGEVVINRSLKGISEKSEKLLKVIRDNFETKTFTIVNLKKKTNWGYSAVRRSVIELLKGGYIYLASKEGKGGTDYYTLDNNPATPINLPTKEEVAIHLRDKVTKFPDTPDNELIGAK